MFSIGEAVIYSTHGVCKVTDISEKAFGSETKKYYVLSPINDPRSVIYVPTDSELLLSRMTRLLTSEEIDTVISDFDPDKLEWIASDSERKEFCGNTLKSGNRLQIMRMVDMLYLKQEDMKKQKKHFHVTDERFLKEGLKMIHDEFAYVLGISPSDVPEYIANKIRKTS